MQNARKSRFCLEEDGFELLSGVPRPDHSRLGNSRTQFFAMRKLMVPLAVQIAQGRLGLNPYSVHFTPPFLRKAKAGLDAREHLSGLTPHAMVHSDYGFGSFKRLTQDPSSYFTIRNPQKRKEVQQAFGKAGRVVVLQFWMNAQPNGTVIENDTLALCHPRSIQLSDLVPRRQTKYNDYPTNNWILHSKNSAAHEWFYWPSLTTNECLVWIGYDSAWGDNMTPCFHTSFHDSSVSSAQPRESIECRVLLLLDEKVPPVVTATLNYLKPEYAPSCPKEYLKVDSYQLQAPKNILVGTKKHIQSARGLPFQLQKDGFELLSGVSRPDYSCFQNGPNCFKTARQCFVPLALQIAREKLGLEP